MQPYNLEPPQGVGDMAGMAPHDSVTSFDDTMPADRQETHSMAELNLKAPQRHEMGVAFRAVNVYGFGSQTDYQKTFANYPVSYIGGFLAFLSHRPKPRVDILKDIEGIVKSGQMLLVLGRPGAGCTSLLKTLAGETNGFHVNGGTMINYQGIRPDEMYTQMRGRCSYQAEFDVHYPLLTVRQTLRFAARARPSQDRVFGKISDQSLTSDDVVESVANSLGLTRALDTIVGNDFVRGVSGGERKRASIAEILAGNSSLQCWDNSTRGLDSANALEFVRQVSRQTTSTGSAAIVSLYQASEDSYQIFDKVLLLYEGQQIFFGSTSAAKTYFTALGFICPERSTTADFLTSLTNPKERIVRKEARLRAPRTAEQFAEIWKNSFDRTRLLQEIQNYEREFPLGSQQLGAAWQGQKTSNPQISVLDIAGPTNSTMFRQEFPRATKRAICSSLSDNCFFGRGALIFFMVLLNATMGSVEGVALWDQRPVIEKHYRYAFYRPIAEAIASVLCDIPNKILLILFFNIPFYFMANLRRTASAFFTFCLFAFMVLLTGSMFYRALGAVTRTLSDSVAPGSFFVILLIIYTGFVIPIQYMHPWLRWFGYINHLSYAFESLMVNEFSGRDFSCSTFIPQGPAYSDVAPSTRMCTSVGAIPDSQVVIGDSYIGSSFQYYASHKWRNLGIIFAIMVFYFALYLLATEYVSLQPSRGEILLFRRKRAPRHQSSEDEEAKGAFPMRALSSEPSPSKDMPEEDKIRSATFVWDRLSYEVKVKKEQKKILDEVEGWVKPGTLTALMGASGAGKTTLLNVLAERAPTGVVSGTKLVDAQFQDESFSRKIGYAQQQDLHLPTATVREALHFSALLRQPNKYKRDDKLAYADHVIDLLDMANFADAVVGQPGEGLNIEQRKRVTIGVELAARPELLLFLDEPTSGLDSDTAWSICNLLRKLARNGQAILCTIHQPSGVLFQMFDRLLFLSEGRSLYFGDLGHHAKTMIDYFERHGATKCGAEANPAEWMLEITSNHHNTENAADWAGIWQKSEERSKIRGDIQKMQESISKAPVSTSRHSTSKYATPWLYQLLIVTGRTLQHDWRTPSFLWAKVLSILGMALINGFSFWKSPNTLQGIQNQIFSLFVLLVLFSTQVQIIMARFTENRTLYEIRERPSRTYSWVVFILSNIIAEIPSQTVLAVITFVAWYYPLGAWRNALEVGQLNERAGLTFFLVWSYMLFSQTFPQMVMTIMPNTPTGVNIANLLYMFCLLFCGVLVSPSALPRFWIFVYRATPLSYYINALIATGLAGVSITCAPNELVTFNPPSFQTCGTYLAPYLRSSPAKLLNPAAREACKVCPYAATNAVLGQYGIKFEQRWRNLGIAMAYNVINVLLALGLYWLVRVPKGARKAR